ncbi:hypothetical protein HYT23_02790 [Candidatus Pacearchaeota archaeon]|nr:hypothetical protein [Candidatus Pacearchaeota archaeon]
MDKTISIYWFAILILVAVAIVYMISAFYGAPYDVREIEASLISNRAADCISQKGELNSFLFGENGELAGFNNDFEERCKITLEVENIWTEPQYYIYLGVFRVGDTNRPIYFYETGNLNLIASCEAQQEKEFENLAKCAEKRFYSIHEGEQYLIKILSAVRKTEKNVK